MRDSSCDSSAVDGRHEQTNDKTLNWLPYSKALKPLLADEEVRSRHDLRGRLRQASTLIFVRPADL